MDRGRRLRWRCLFPTARTASGSDGPPTSALDDYSSPGLATSIGASCLRWATYGCLTSLGGLRDWHDTTLANAGSMARRCGCLGLPRGHACRRQGRWHLGHGGRFATNTAWHNRWSGRLAVVQSVSAPSMNSRSEANAWPSRIRSTVGPTPHPNSPVTIGKHPRNPPNNKRSPPGGMDGDRRRRYHCLFHPVRTVQVSDAPLRPTATTTPEWSWPPRPSTHRCRAP